MNPIKKLFIESPVSVQEEFCIDMHRVICRIIANKVGHSWCGRVLLLWKEKIKEKHENLNL